jgi:hypothetical protein
MQIIITEKLYNGSPAKAQSADGRYVWFWGQDGYLHDNKAGLSIYQMHYMRTHEMGGDPVPDDVRNDARAFWAALSQEKQRAEKAHEAAELAEIAAEIEVRKSQRYRPDVADHTERARQERLYDDIHNEGAEGYNPWRDL